MFNPFVAGFDERGADEVIYGLLIGGVWLFLSLGMVGLFKFKTFYGRLLNNSLIDSVAFIFLIAALIAKSGWSTMSLRLVVIGVFFLLTNPVVTQMIAHAAHKNTAMEDDDHDLD